MRCRDSTRRDSTRESTKNRESINKEIRRGAGRGGARDEYDMNIVEEEKRLVPTTQQLVPDFHYDVTNIDRSNAVQSSSTTLVLHMLSHVWFRI